VIAVSCRLDPKELEKFVRILSTHRDLVYDGIYEEVLEETGDEARAEAKAEKWAEEIDRLIDKLYRGECPNRREKVIIRSALLGLCTKEQKDMMKRAFPKLKMRWTRIDDWYLCEM
jgi:hypothetical protein